MEKNLRKSGIDIIGDVPWGTHFCQFYQTREDLMDILVPYFKAGLENNEFCMWVTSQTVEVEEAKESLRRAVPDFDVYLEKGQIEIIPYTHWYLKEGIFDSERVLNGWIEKLNHAQVKGYAGLRLSGDTFWLEKKDWNGFVEYEEKIDNIIGNYPMIALCTYSLDRCKTTEAIDVVVNHQFSLVKKEEKWKRIESPKCRKAQETALQATKNWEYTFDAIPDLIAIIDTKHQIVRANRAMAAKLGISPEECSGLTCYCLIHGTDNPPSFCLHRQLLMDGLEHTKKVHEDYLCGDFMASVSPLHDSEGKLIGYIHVARDISKRQRAEESLCEGEELLRFALETSHTGVWALDFVDHTIHRSLEHDRIFGYEQLLPHWTHEMFLEHVLPEDRTMVDAKFRKAEATNSDWNYECRIRRVDGVIRWIWAAGEHRADATGNVHRTTGIVQDITERKQLEEQTRQRAEEIEAIMEVAPVAIWIGHDPQGQNITGNLMANELYEAEVGENVSANINPVRRFFRNGRELTADELPMQEAALKDIDIHNVELDALLPSGEWRGILGSASPLHDAEGRVRGSVGAFIDITERKKVEEALRKSEEKYRNLIETANEGIWILDAKARTTYVNEKMAKMVRYSREALVEKAVLDFADEEGEAIFKRKMKRRRQGINEIHEFKLLRKDGLPLWVLISSKALFDKDGKFTGSMGMFTDITKRKKAEIRLKETLDNLENLVKERTAELEKAYNSLKESETGLAEAQQMAHIGNWCWDIAINKIYWSDELYRIFRRDPQELAPSYNEYLNYIHPDDRAYFDNASKNALNGIPYSIDHRIILANGEKRTVHIQSEVILNEENIPILIRGIVQDITEQKKAEEKLQTLVNAVESSDDAIITRSLDGIITSWNKGAEQIYGYFTEEILGKNVSILEPDNLKGELNQLDEKIKQGKRVRHYETLRLKKDGTIINISITLSPVFDASGKLVTISTVSRDITENKKAEEALEKIQEIHIKEIHHRIKNNLQVISSLLSLEAERFSDEKMLEAFQESQNRITSMALIHEELHRGNELDTLDFAAYLQNLTADLFSSYNLNDAISLKLDLEQTHLGMDTAIPLGIIVNELVSNSLKHAFPAGRAGEIHISLCKTETFVARHDLSDIMRNRLNTDDFHYILTVADNGIGFSEGKEFPDTDSLGLQLVNILVEQIDGSVELKRDKGTEFIILFKNE